MSGPPPDFTLTPNLGLFKPNYNLDVDDWGEHLNANADILDLELGNLLSGGPYLPLTGGQLSGPLITAAGSGGSNLGIGIGNNTTGLWSSGGNALILQTGGSSNVYLSPTGNQMAQSLQMMGAAMLTLAAAPTANLHAATKAYVDGRTPITTDAPATSVAYGRYNNGWVSTLLLSGGTLTGPLILAADPTASLGAATKQYVDSAAGHNDGRNFIHNGLFAIRQRGAGPFAASGYTLDRWLAGAVTDTISITSQVASDTDRAQVGDEAMTNFLRNVFTGNAAAGAYNTVVQRIEGVRRLGGKTVTVSFWALASAALNLGVNMSQNFGTTGSPSAPVALPGSSVALGTTWQRYSLQFTLPSTAAKVLGTDNNDFTQVSFWFSSGSTNATVAGNPGVQSGTISLWGVQVEIGAMTALDKRDPQQEFARCQRFFQDHPMAQLFGYQTAGGNMRQTFWLPTQMRALPNVTIVGPSYTNASGYILNNYGPDFVQPQATVTAAGSAMAMAELQISADL